MLCEGTFQQIEIPMARFEVFNSTMPKLQKKTISIYGRISIITENTNYSSEGNKTRNRLHEMCFQYVTRLLVLRLLCIAGCRSIRTRDRACTPICTRTRTSCSTRPSACPRGWSCRWPSSATCSSAGRPAPGRWPRPQRRAAPSQYLSASSRPWRRSLCLVSKSLKRSRAQGHE